MIDVRLRVLPGGAEQVATLAAVPGVGCWVETPAGTVAVDLVLFQGGAVLLVGHAVAAGLVAERLHARPVEPDPAFTLKG